MALGVCKVPFVYSFVFAFVLAFQSFKRILSPVIHLYLCSFVFFPNLFVYYVVCYRTKQKIQQKSNNKKNNKENYLIFKGIKVIQLLRQFNFGVECHFNHLIHQNEANWNIHHRVKYP